MIDPRVEIVLGRRILHREGCDSNVGGQVTVRSADGETFLSVSAFFGPGVDGVQDELVTLTEQVIGRL